MIYIDSHAHLWDSLHGRINSYLDSPALTVTPLGGGKCNFGGAVRQMMPAYFTDCRNTAEQFISNMDYGCVYGAVIVQEYIDGCQDAYLKSARVKYGDRLRVTSLYEENDNFSVDGFDGIKFCGGRLKDQDLTHHEKIFKTAAENGMFIAIDMADGDTQCASLREMAQTYPDLRIAIGHFGMVTVPGWQEQIKLACLPNVRIESGGITWLFHIEFYPYPSAVRAIKEAADIAGIEKLMWGSDYPRTMSAVTYEMSRDFINKSNELTDYEKACFLGENAIKFYGFKNPAEMTRPLNMVE